MRTIKIGFLVESLRGLGITNPDVDFLSATLKSWAIKVGDTIAEDDLLAEVDTDKATTELFSAWAGIIVALDYDEDETWEVGVTKDGNELSERSEDTPFGKILLPPLGYIEVDDDEEKSSTDASVSESPEVPVDESPLEEPNLEEAEISSKETPYEKGGSERVRAAPIARRLADERKIDINTVQGTGIGGRVMLSDVKQAIEADVASNQAEQIPDDTGQESGGIVLLTPSREWLTIAHNLEKGSNSFIAAGEPEDYDFSALMSLRSNHREEFKKVFGVDLKVSAPMILAIIRTLRSEDFWLFNSYWHITDQEDRSKDKIALHRSVNMGISVDLGEKPQIDLSKKTIKGTRLRIATMQKADELGIHEFFGQHSSLIDRAAHDIRENGGKVKETNLADWMGWTFIFNNVGAAGHIRGISLFTPKMSAMLNMGVIGPDGKANLQIFFDHRMIDGVPATMFLDAVYEELIKRVLPEIELACVGI